MIYTRYLVFEFYGKNKSTEKKNRQDINNPACFLWYARRDSNPQ